MEAPPGDTEPCATFGELPATQASQYMGDHTSEAAKYLPGRIGLRAVGLSSVVFSTLIFPAELALTVALLGRPAFFDVFVAGGANELCVPNRPRFIILAGVTGRIGCASVCCSPDVAV